MKKWFIRKILSWIFNSETGQKFKANAAKKINERLDIPHLDEDQEAKLIVAILDAAWEAANDWLEDQKDEAAIANWDASKKWHEDSTVANTEPEE